MQNRAARCCLIYDGNRLRKHFRWHPRALRKHFRWHPRSSREPERAKASARIKVFRIPKRSPDLNVCDYALWSAVNRNMRRQEQSFPKAKRETRAEHIARLRRAAQSLSSAFIDKAISDMCRRCQLLYNRRGGLFEEGGRCTFG